MMKPNPTQVEAAISESARFLRQLYMPKFRRFADMHDVASQHTADALERGELPAEWARKLVIPRLRRDVARGMSKKPKGRNPLENMARDYAVTMAVHNVIVDYGFPPTRNRATQDSESACSIVVSGLSRLGMEITEQAIEKIWEKRLLKEMLD